MGRNGHGALGRARHAVANYGSAELLREATRRARTWSHRTEEHRWWERDLTAAPPPQPMPTGFTLGRLQPDEVDRAADLPFVNFGAAPERYRSGGEFWVVTGAAGRVVFGVWLFPRRLPVHVAPRGWIGMPPGVVGMEDGAVAPEAAKAHITRPALDAIAEHYRDRGAHVIVVKTETANRPVAFLLSRSGYRRVARMRSTFAGPVRVAALTDVRGVAMPALVPALTGGPATRALAAGRRHGALGTARRLGAAVRAGVHERERHLWWELDLVAPRKDRPLPEGLRLTELTRAEMHRARDLPYVDAGAADERRAAGGRFWAVLDGERVLFGVWSFVERMPARAADGGWMPVPEGYVGLEDAATATDRRRRGIAAGALSAIADRLAADGHRGVVAKTEAGNAPMVALLDGLGFRCAAVMNATFVGPHRRVRLTGGAAPASAPLADALR